MSPIVVQIGNLDSNVNEDDIKRLCSPYGVVRYVLIPRDGDGRLQGFAEVIMSTDEEALAAESLNGTEFQSRSLRVRLLIGRTDGKWIGTTSSLSRLLAQLRGNTKYRIVIVGLKGGGKSTLLNKLAKWTGDITYSSIAIGHNLETLELKRVSIVAWDVGFPNEIRSLWQPYLENTDGLIFVVDSVDLQRMAEAKKELDRLMNDDRLRDTVLFVIANKQDSPNALSTENIQEQLGLHSLRQRNWFLEGTSIEMSDGSHEGFEWLINQLIGRRPANQHR